MTFSSDFWLNLLYFVVQTFLALIGIWIGLYLYMRQEKKEQDKKYNDILTQIKQVDERLIRIEQKTEKIDNATSLTQNQLIGTQREVIYHLTGINSPVRESLTDSDLPKFKKGKKKILTDSSQRYSTKNDLTRSKR